RRLAEPASTLPQSPWPQPAPPRDARTLLSPRVAVWTHPSLGLPVAPSPSSWPETPPDRDDRTLLSRNLDRQRPWLNPEQPVPVGHVLTAAAELGWAPGRVAQRLMELGMKLVPGLQVSGAWREGAVAPIWDRPRRWAALGGGADGGPGVAP